MEGGICLDCVGGFGVVVIVIVIFGLFVVVSIINWLIG